MNAYRKFQLFFAGVSRFITGYPSNPPCNSCRGSRAQSHCSSQSRLEIPACRMIRTIEIDRNFFRMRIWDGEYQSAFDHVRMFPALIRTVKPGFLKLADKFILRRVVLSYASTLLSILTRSSIVQLSIGGMGSPLLSRTMIQPSMTATRFFRHSSRVRPLAQTPASSGTSP